MRHLIKEGKRRCYRCKEILPLTSKHFSAAKGRAGGFGYACKPCHRIEGDIHKIIRSELIVKAKNKCRKCKLYNADDSFFDIDHILPKQAKSRLKRSDVGNLQVLCPNCHRLKTIKDRAIR